MTHVLVVDDSAVDRSLAGGLLARAGHTVAYATDGREALATIDAQRPDLVLTDLQMPAVDGLALVQHTQGQQPLLPVIVMTAFGSEELAVEALRAGAAGYVPKRTLAANLIETVHQVMSVARADHCQKRLLGSTVEQDMLLVLENDSSLIGPLVDLVQQLAVRLQVTDESGRMRIGMAVTEALVNALYHGNLEITSEQLLAADADDRSRETLQAERRATPPFCDRRLHVRLAAARGELRITIRDEGPGFDVAGVPDPTAPENLTKASGRGLVMMRMFMDEVSFNDAGNEVTMVKRRSVSDPPAGRGARGG